MSYDVSIEVASGPEAVVVAFDANYTSNVSRMWAHALQVPDKPLYNDDGTRRTCRRKNDQTGEWETAPYDAWGLAALDGAPCSEVAGVLARAVQRMESEPDIYRKWEPDNGWGDYDGALFFLRSIAEAAAAHSHGRLAVHH